MRPVRIWLAVVAAMILAMVLVGGATRLTESGLSIVEWKPITGTLPPLTADQWAAAFEGYKAIPQYREMNRGMSLEQFKTIFWWEWAHRLLGRTIGAAYLFPFLFFLWRGGLTRSLTRRLWLIFGLGGLQGAVGWWMVASGLAERTEVSQYRLATHLALAVFIYAAILWSLRRIRPEHHVSSSAPARLSVTANILVALTFVQLYFGGLVAGLRAGRIYNTWPEIDGAFVPSAERLWFDQPWWRNLFENALTVQFEHRMTAYLLIVLAWGHAVDAIRARASGSVASGALWLAGAVSLQALVGILTLLYEVPLALALVHQAAALLVLSLAIVQAERLSKSPAEARVGDGLRRVADSAAR